MRKLIKKKRGQVLVIAITAMFVLFIFGIAIVEIGNLVYEKIHMQSIADSGAMEAGTWYARALNLTSLSNKILVTVAGIAMAFTSLSGPGAIIAMNEATAPIRAMQDAFAGTGTGALGKAQVVPWLCWGSVLLNGKRNDVFSLAVFNVETFNKYKLPSFNLERRTLYDLLDSEQLQTKYYYVEEDSGKKVNVPKQEVIKNKAGRIYQKETGKFVIKEQGPAGDSMPENIREPLEKILKIAGVIKDVPLVKEILEKAEFDIVETGPHTVLVGSFKDKVKQKLGTKFFMGDDKKPVEPFLAACALVRIDGGSMYFWEMDGASYSPHLDKVQLPSLADFGSAESGEIIAQAGEYVKNNDIGGAGNSFSGAFGYMDKASKLLTDGVLLH